IKAEAKSEVIKDILFNWNFSDFMDGKPYVKTTIHSMLNNKNFLKINSIIAGIIMLILVIAPFAISSETTLRAKLLFLVPIIPIIIVYLYLRKLYNDLK
ncbi:patatin, partial [Chryseobacterium mucoviscidosis]